MAIWIKPSGVEVELNESPATIEAARANKWKLKGEKKPKPKKEETKPKAE